ncbi:hypothetical protein D3C75_1149270 [compost metagenome]
MRVVAEHVVLVLDLVRELQGQATGAVGSQVEQGNAVKRRFGQRRPVLARWVAERQLTAGLGKTGEGGGEGLAHRTDLEQGVGVDGLPRLY